MRSPLLPPPPLSPQLTRFNSKALHCGHCVEGFCVAAVSDRQLGVQHGGVVWQVRQGSAGYQTAELLRQMCSVSQAGRMPAAAHIRDHHCRCAPCISSRTRVHLLLYGHVFMCSSDIQHIKLQMTRPAHMSPKSRRLFMSVGTHGRVL